MKNININLKLVVSVAALLFIIILFQSYFEYRSSRGAILELMSGQTDALIRSVARGGEKGIIAYEFQQREIGDHLITFAAAVDRIELSGADLDGRLFEMFPSGNLRFIILLDNRGRIIRTIRTDKSDKAMFQIDSERLSSIMKGGLPSVTMGLIKSDNGASYYSAAVKRSKGGTIIAGIDAGKLLTLRKSFGAGSVINFLSESPGVMYIGIIKNGMLLAASNGFPKNIDDPWYKSGLKAGEDTKTRLVKSSGEGLESVFEAAGLFTVAGEVYAEIVIGINTTGLELITSKLKHDIILRSILFLIVAVIAIAGVTVKQNYSILASKYQEIRRDVQRLEADRASNEKLSAMGELAAGVAHEIRNPLNAIRVIIQRLQREFKPESDNDEYGELTAILKKETDRINETIAGFLEMARPPVLKKSRGDMVDCLNELISLFQHRADAKGCKIIKELNIGPEMMFDRDLCKQGILNLLENALSAVGKGGTIKIKTYCDKKICTIEIEDDGPGIPDELKSRVFDIYYTTKDTGTGLGLPTVHRIVKEHGGRVELTDSPLGGACFKMEIPIE